MPNEGKALGLGLQGAFEKKAAEDDRPITPAKPLIYFDGKRVLGINELLLQIEDGANQFLERNSHLGNTFIRNTAILCKGMAGGMYQGGKEKNATYEGLEHSLVTLGYLYSNLTSLSRHDHENMVNAMLKRQAGPMSIENEREHGREWLRERATEIWNCDHNQEKRIGEVAGELIALARAEQDRRKMERDESAKHWALSPDKVKKAIRPVAPEYASRKGRPTKN